MWGKSDLEKGGTNTLTRSKKRKQHRIRQIYWGGVLVSPQKGVVSCRKRMENLTSTSGNLGEGRRQFIPEQKKKQIRSRRPQLEISRTIFVSDKFLRGGLEKENGQKEMMRGLRQEKKKGERSWLMVQEKGSTSQPSFLESQQQRHGADRQGLRRPTRGKDAQPGPVVKTERNVHDLGTTGVPEAEERPEVNRQKSRILFGCSKEKPPATSW